MTDIFNAENMFITSDLHFFHNKIAKYCKRPYDCESDGDIYRMNEDILQKFDSLPDTKDTVVWNLGDFAFGDSLVNCDNPTVPLKNLVLRMKGKNRVLALVLGNHDRELFEKIAHKTNCSSVVKFYEELGFDAVFARPFFFDDRTIFSHEPFYIPPKSVFKNIHGHIHNAPLTDDYFELAIENYDMKRIAAEMDSMENIPERIHAVHDKKVSLDDYFNVCIDDTGFEILDLKEIIQN